MSCIVPTSDARCDKCGACCCTFPVRVSKSDAERNSQIGESGLVLPGWQQTQEHYYQLHPLPFLEGCAFLSPDKLCGIYETRPDVCRRFEAGSWQCLEARRRIGLPALADSTANRPADAVKI